MKISYLSAEDSEFLKKIIEKGSKSDSGYFQYAHIAAVLLPKQLHEQLYQLVNGPVEDGDIISKDDRIDLFRLGLATRVCCKGEQGYTGATYFAYSVNKKIKEIREGKICE